MPYRPVHNTSALSLFAIMLAAVTAIAGAEPQTGDLVDLAMFGTQVNNGTDVCLAWDESRDVRQVQVSGVSAEVAKSLELQWWGGTWPNGNREEEFPYGGGGGWQVLDDCYNGTWVRVAVEPVKAKDSDVWTFTIPTMSKDEWNQYLDPERYAAQKCSAFRRTFKIRVVTKANQTLPPTLRLQAFSDSRWQKGRFDVDFRLPQDSRLAGQISVANGELLSSESLPVPRTAAVSGNTWRVEGSKDGSAGIRVSVRYVHNADGNSNDLTRITVRLGVTPDAAGFSFVPEDMLAAGAMHLPDFGALVAPSEKQLSWTNTPKPLGEYWKQRVRGRVAKHTEATRVSAMAGIPRLAPPPPVPLGMPSARQKFLVTVEGNWSTSLESLYNLDNGRDYKRWGLDHQFGKQISGDLQAVFDTRSEPAFDGNDREDVVRSLDDGYLPIIHVKWHTGPIQYHQFLTTTALLGDYGDDVARRGDETVVLLSRLDMTNPSDEPKPAAVNLRYSNATPIALRDDGVIAIEPQGIPEGLFAQRGVISLGKPAGGGAKDWAVVKSDDPQSPPVLSYRTTLQPHETRAVYFKATFVDLLDKDELVRLKEVDFEKESASVREYWRKRMADGMQICVPDPAVNDLYKANLWHVVITTSRDPETGLYNQGVGTIGYKICPNETIMIARSMDMRREHREAERFIEPMLHYQGTELLKGRFSTKEGAFHGAGKYSWGEYAMNHGFVLWGAADHYLVTHDRAYIERVAPQLIKGCDFLINERRATMGRPDAPRSAIHGLTPASSLEDVTEFKYWFAVNGYFYLGMKRTAEALAAVHHPEAKRIADEAERYRRDIETAARQATASAAVVRLRDGAFIPYVPSRVGQWRHLTEGMTRESMYCTLHLATAEVVPPTDRLMTWMLDELEDNIFFSAESGYGVKDCDKTWFEQGGVTMQPCMLDMPPVYMARDEIPAALRSFWNTYAMSLHPDVQCFAEWVPRFGKAGGPLYKTSDESRFVMWLRQLLLWENGDQLWFGRATPRQWLEDGKTVQIENAGTLFGPAGMVLKSEVAQRRIRALLQIPREVPPKEVWLRLRHPAGQRPTRVLVNGRVVPPSDVSGEDIRLTPDRVDAAKRVEIVAEYQH
jgi:hypothetical protein